MTECAQCGRCCEVLSVGNYTKKDFRAMASEDGPFASKHWHRIAKPTARARNPLLVSNQTAKHAKYYTCDQYDSETHECLAHETKPPVCRGFPWYGQSPNPRAISFLPTCSYWVDVPQERWPDGIIPLTSVSRST